MDADKLFFLNNNLKYMEEVVLPLLLHIRQGSVNMGLRSPSL